MRVESLSRVHSNWTPDLRLLLQTRQAEALETLEQLGRAGIGNIVPLFVRGDGLGKGSPIYLREMAVDSLLPGDVVAVTPGAPRVNVLYRCSDLHHTVFLTNRCNSSCLMCSQPPTPQDDSWLIDEAMELARHIEGDPATIGFTGGEPLLLGARLREVLDAYRDLHPTSDLEVLSNGRLFSDRHLSEHLLGGQPSRITWMIPLYGHVASLHDYVVQVSGAFEQTLLGLFALHEHRQPIQLRVVLVRSVVEELEQICTFIGRNLPFVQEVALMGCEPIGFALANRGESHINIHDWQDELVAGVLAIVRNGIRPVLMNLPLCVIPPKVRKYAHKSISDWKQVYADECTSCTEKENCSGLFAWHNKGWLPAPLQAIREEMA